MSKTRFQAKTIHGLSDFITGILLWLQGGSERYFTYALADKDWYLASQMASSRGAHRSLYWEGIHHHFGTYPLGLWNDTVWYSSQLLQNRTVNNQICRSANTNQNKLPSSNARSNSQMMSASLNSPLHRLKILFLILVSLFLLYFFGWCCKVTKKLCDKKH